MDFYEVLDQVVALLRTRGRVTYRALKLQFQLDDEHLEALKEELIEAQRVAADDGKVLVWTGGEAAGEKEKREKGKERKKETPSSDSGLRTPNSELLSAERRQLTVMFCDLVGSTALSTQLDPEDLREVVQAYQETCTEVIRRYDGHIAQHLGDGLLVYFGYPAAHEDDAQRAVRTGLEIVAALHDLNPRLQCPLQVRIGIHTGLVVIGEIGSADKHEILALGETPNLAARLQGIAQPDTVVISAATQRLIAGFFTCRSLGLQELKNVPVPLEVYQVLAESTVQGRFAVALRTGLTPLVGRDHEVGLLRERWERVKDGEGQVILLSGEPGIGKSRLVEVLKETVVHEGASYLELHCSPYAQNSALYPVIEHVQRLLHLQADETPENKLEKLQRTLSRSHFPQADTLPLLAALLSLPHPKGYPPLTLSPQRQKQKTQEAVVSWLMEEAEQTAVYCVWEDLHWADPSTLELLGLLLDQVPTARLLVLLTSRPEFTPPWASRSHLTPLALSRLPRTQVEEMVERVTGGKALPAEVLHQIVGKTDGVPLFVEELTKMVLESGLLTETDGRYALTGPLPPLAIPATLHDSLMARLDRLGTAREVAQLGATLGREFSYELIQAVSPLEETSLHQALVKLIEAEVLYQRGVPPQTRYLFKHALIQDVAYQSLLKSRRQQYHQQIAQVLEKRFPETTEIQPELLAHHYTEAGLIVQAIPYWQRAGQRAVHRSANAEAISHLTKGLELLKPLPDTPERAQQELDLQTTLGIALTTKGFGSPEVEQAYTRARELCRQIGETAQLFPVLAGLMTFYSARGEHHTARELAEQLLSLAQRVQDPALLLEAHHMLGGALFCLGELTSAQGHLEQSIALYDPQQHRSHAFRYGGHDPGVCCLSQAALDLWLLGYPDQALQRIQEALTLAHELSHFYSLAQALYYAVTVHQFRREVQATHKRAEELIGLSREQGFPIWSALGTALQGWVLTEQGQVEEGIAKLRQGLTAFRATGAELGQPYRLALLAEACGKGGQAEEGLAVLAEALEAVHRTGERTSEARLYRLKGQLTLQKEARGWRLETGNQRLETGDWRLDPSPQASSLKPPAFSQASSLKPQVSREVEQEAEGYFLQAIAIARRQSAKSLELQAVMDLARLWQQQGKKDEARQMLGEIYNWFTEGFDTVDLKEAKALLEELSSI